MTPLSPPLLQLLPARTRDLGGMTVGRVLPERTRRNLGAVVFLDHLGPVDFAPGQDTDVRPHPHIGLATLTWMLEGELLHRDSLGTVQAVRPGEVNWMFAGRGITHSERVDPALRARGQRVHALQLWIAAADHEEESEPRFAHLAADQVPRWTEGPVQLRLVSGTLGAWSSPLPLGWPVVLLDLTFDGPGRYLLPSVGPERGVYGLSPNLSIGGEDLHNRLAVLDSGPAVLVATGPARAFFLAGAPVGPRHLLWNFASSRPERLIAAREDWRAGRFPKIPGDDQEFVPFPG